MSRIGKKPVTLVRGTSASISGQTIEVKGPKGTRSFTAGDDVTLTIEGDTVKVTPRGLSKRARQQWGMTRSMVENLVTGVSDGSSKEMEIQGVGYRAAMAGNVLKLSLGYSHEVNFDVPDGGDHHRPEADRDHRGRHRPAAGRPGRREHPRVARARALQGQGHPLQG